MPTQSSHFLTDKSLSLESQFGGWGLARRRTFAEPGVEPHYAPDRAFQIEHIGLELDIDPVAKGFRGLARIRFTAMAGSRPRTWSLDLDEVTVESVTDRSGVPVVWKHADGKLLVPAIDEVVVRWHGSPRRGLYFVGPTPAEPARIPEVWSQCQDEDAHYIFPCFDHPSMKHAFTTTVNVPPGYTCVGNGRLKSREGDRWVWDQAEPMPAYLWTVVVMRATTVSEEWEGVPLGYVVPEGQPEALVKKAFGRTPAMIEFLSGLYGRYPWPRYDQVVVHDFIFGGMENTAATTLLDLVLTDVAELEWDPDELIVHEMAHQWFGDLVTCQDWSQGWLNEGWATYTEYLWNTHHQGKDHAAYALWEQLGIYLSEDGGRYRRPIVSYLFREPIDVFDRHLYEKGALVLHTLRAELGDSAFWAGVTLYLSRHRYQTVHTRHFQRAMEDATGRTLDRFFEQWVFSPGHPTLKVALSHADGLVQVHVKQTQEGEGVPKAYSFPLQIGFGDRAYTVTVDQRERGFSFPADEAPDFVRVDGDFAVLAEINLKAPRSWLIAQLEGDPGVIGRIRAAKALDEEGSLEAVESLAVALGRSPFWGVRAEIAELLGERGGVRATAALIVALADPSARVRRGVAAALAGIRRPEAAAALVARSSDPSFLVEGEIARSLGKLRAPEARARCESLLTRESWSEVLRCRAIEGISFLRDASVLPLVLGWTQVDKPSRARAACCGALARLGDEVEATRTSAVERLIELAEDDNFRVQVAAINALGTLRDVRATAVLERAHSSAGDGRCRRLAFEALANIREGRTSTEGLATLRGQVDSLADDSRTLRDRLEKVEGPRPTAGSVGESAK
ncbi:MAG: hypothetical protein EXR69_11420 [Myxococcales bacterium]|nr:hypothetical protein [Myxococcales bacterium]